MAGDEKEELREEIESLKKQIDYMEGMIENLMNMHKNVLENIASNAPRPDQHYTKMLSIYQRFGKISPSILPEIKDPISEGIVEILLDSSALNITQITERLREKRGKASRHTVRERLNRLERKKVVKKVDEGKGKTYELTDRMVNKWAEVLGIKK